MTLNVAISSPSFAKSTTLMDEIRSLGVRVTANAEGRRFDEAGLINFLSDAKADIAVVGLEPVTQAVLESLPNLKAICKYGVGLDNVDTEAMRRRGVALGWTGGVNRRSVSELVLAFVLGHVRNATQSIARMRAGRWEKDGGRQLSNLTLGIVGFGNIGTDLASLLTHFGTTLLCCDILDKGEECRQFGVKQVDYDELIAASDVISFHVPSTPKTKSMFGAVQVERCGKRTLIVNTARGDIVDFDAVCRAVSQGKLGGFASDVFPDEPYDASAWAKTDHLYFTPHIGGNAAEAVLAMGRSAIDHVRSFLRERGQGPKQ